LADRAARLVALARRAHDPERAKAARTEAAALLQEVTAAQMAMDQLPGIPSSTGSYRADARHALEGLVRRLGILSLEADCENK